MQSRNNSTVLGYRDTPSHKPLRDPTFEGWTLSRHHTLSHPRSAPRRLIRATHPIHDKQRESVQSYYQSTIRSFLSMHKDVLPICERTIHLSMRDRLHSFTPFDRPRYSVDWLRLATKESPRKASMKSRKTKDFINRLELAKSIGLPEVPTQSDASFDQLYGLFDDIMKYETQHDSVESLKRLRRE